MSEIKFFNYKLSTDIKELPVTHEAGQRATVVSCLNTHSFVTALDDKEFCTALETTDVLLPDGEGICSAVKALKRCKINKIAGDDLHTHILERMSKTGGRLYYMGSSEEVLLKIRQRIGREHPNIAVRTFSPPMCDELSQEESKIIIDDIETFAPDVLFVSMTAPKQEKWIQRYRTQLTTPSVVAAIGAVFEFYAKTSKRAPQWAINMKMEWLARLIKEPSRMWRRVFVSTPRFAWWIWKNRETV